MFSCETLETFLCLFSNSRFVDDGSTSIGSKVYSIQVILQLISPTGIILFSKRVICLTINMKKAGNSPIIKVACCSFSHKKQKDTCGTRELPVKLLHSIYQLMQL